MNNIYWERLEIVIKATGHKTLSSFARAIGLRNVETLSQVKKGNNKLSIRLAERINKQYPEFSVYWLLFGEQPKEGPYNIIPFYDSMSDRIKKREPITKLAVPYFLIDEESFAVKWNEDIPFYDLKNSYLFWTENHSTIIPGTYYFISYNGNRRIVLISKNLRTLEMYTSDITPIYARKSEVKILFRLTRSLKLY